MDARASAALRVALGHDRDDVIAELQARIPGLERQNRVNRRICLENEWEHLMLLTIKLVLHGNFNDDAMSAVLPRRLFSLICEAGYGFREEVNITGHRHVGPLDQRGTLACRIHDSIEARLHMGHLHNGHGGYGPLGVARLGPPAWHLLHSLSTQK